MCNYFHEMMKVLFVDNLIARKLILPMFRLDALILHNNMVNHDLGFNLPMYNTSGLFLTHEFSRRLGED